ncbi:MAG: ribosome biogenesis GTPase Der [Anaerolineales bacterium]|nr:ribosome biogenesis GTPase Der [Anaerolineales bacterium]
MRKPIVALVGRPNVGKSTLFNRLVGERLAVVDDTPGTTRDRLMAEGEWQGRTFDVVDTGGIDPDFFRRGQPLSTGSADYIQQIRLQAEMAIRHADLVLFLVEGETGVTPADAEVADILRKQRGTGKGEARTPILLVVNKCENRARREQAAEFYELGMSDPYPVSALHGIGVGDLLDAMTAALPPMQEAEEGDERIRIAIVGKPNVGKSSLLNRLLGEERVIVSPIPGTTRDAVDTEAVYRETPITLIDTAGIRRRGKIEPGVEQYSVLRSLRAIERADIVLLVLDATEGIAMQDAHIAGFILEARRSTVVIVNKWDAVEKDTYSMDSFQQVIRKELDFMDYVPVLFVSARTGQRTGEILPMALRVQEERLVRIPTSEFNRIIREAVEKHAPPSHSGRKLKLNYASQVKADPPTFLFHVNDPTLVHFSYRRYLENQIRKHYPFLGTPLVFSFRKKT